MPNQVCTAFDRGGRHAVPVVQHRRRHAGRRRRPTASSSPASKASRSRWWCRESSNGRTTARGSVRVGSGGATQSGHAVLARWALAAAGLTVLLAGCAKDAPQDTWQPAGTNAQKIQNLQWPVFLIAGIVGVHRLRRRRAAACIRFRDRGQAIPKQTHGNRRARDRAHDPAGADPRRRRRSPPSARCSRSPRPTTPSASSTSPASSGGGRTTTRCRTGCGGIDRRRSSPAASWSSPTDTNVLLRVTSRDVIHSFWIPQAQRQARHGARPRPDAAHAGRPARHLRRPVHRVLRARPRQHAHGGRRARSADDFETWVANQLAAVHAAGRRARSPPTGEATFIAQCSRCHQVNGLVNADGDPVIAQPED